MRRTSRHTFAALALLTGALLTIGCGDGGTAGPQGPAGEPGPKGEPGDPSGSGDESISALSPHRVFLQRTIDVQISGNGTAWKEGATVDFGPGITVSEINVASPTAILATITVEDTAELGARDVMVKDGASSVTFSGAFKVEAPLAVPGYAGTLAQGSIFIARAEQRDISTPFDSSGDAENGFPYLSVESAAGLDLVVQDAQPYTLDLLVFADVKATTGAIDVTVKSGLSGGETTSQGPAAFSLEPRTPLPLGFGMPAVLDIAKPLESQLYTIAPSSAGKLITVEAATSAAGVEPLFALLPSSGSFDDAIGFGSRIQYVTTNAEPLYVVYWNNGSDVGYSVDLKAIEQDTNDIEPNDTCATAQPAAPAPLTLKNLTLSSEKDVDWFTVAVPESGVGKQIHVVTSPGDNTTDTRVEVFGGDCNALKSLGGPSKDLDYHENHLSSKIPAAGTYYVKVSNSTFGYTGQGYNLSISLSPSDTEPGNDTCVMPEVIKTLPGTLVDMSLSSDADEDWIQVDVKPEDVGRSLRIMTSPGDAKTDTLINVFGADCATEFGFQSDDFNYHEDFTTIPLPVAGPYFIRVSASPAGYTGALYTLSVEVVDPPEKEPNNSAAEAQTINVTDLDGLTKVDALSLSGNDDQDWFKFNLPAQVSGLKLEVITLEGEPNTDTLLEVFMDDGSGNLVSLGVSNDQDYHEDLTTEPLTGAGTYYVKVSASTLGTDGSYYTLAFILL